MIERIELIKLHRAAILNERSTIGNWKRMTKEGRNPNDKEKCSALLRHLSIRASFVIRASSLPLIHPLITLGNKDGQFFHHVLGFADRTDHVRAGGAVPLLRHLLAGVAAPTLDVSATRKNAATDLCQLGVVQPRFTGAVDVVAVIEHETGPVGMPEIFEAGYLQAFAVLAVVQVVDHVAPVLKINQVEMKLFPHRIDVADQVLVFLFGPVE